MSERMKKDILEAQLMHDTTVDGSVHVASPTSLTLEACKCKHLQKYLPHVLDLSCAILTSKDANPNGEAETQWIMANPVHALHMASQLEPDGATVSLPKDQAHGEPAIYGEEQCRAKALTTNGISPAVELTTNEDTDKDEYVTRSRLYPSPHYPSHATSATMSAPAAPHPSNGMQQGSPIMMPPPATTARRPSLPSCIVPPTNPQQRHLLPKPPPGSTTLPPQPLAPRGSSAVAQAPMPPRGPPPKPTSNSSNRATTATRSSSTMQNLLLPNERFEELRRRESTLLQYHQFAGPNRRKTQQQQKSSKRKRGDAALLLLPNAEFTKTVYTVTNFPKWQQDQCLARATVEEWMERFRISRIAYWREQQGKCDVRTCHVCGENQYSSEDAQGDELMQCLECNFVGCGPKSILEDSRQHMMHHMITTGHSFAVTCGERAEVFCFKCGDFVYHTVFDQERERIDISHRLPWMGWHDHAVQRSFDAMQFINTNEHGIVWRGMIASYPPLVPRELVRAGRLSMRRLLVSRGQFASPYSLSWGSKALGFAVHQNQQESAKAVQIPAPVGMYNLGNTCFMTCILQCLIHCVPFQRHFLDNVGHHYKSCELIRGAFVRNDSTSSGQSTSSNKTIGADFQESRICLACEMDKLFLQYFGSSIGRDVTRAVCQGTHPLDYYGDSAKSKVAMTQGDPLVTTRLLAAAWKCGGMDHLAGYEQGDAHEFLQAFLDTVGKHEGESRKLIRFMQRMATPSYARDQASASVQNADIVKQLFEGTLRSVLICGECGCKRKMPESFLNVSVPLSKTVGGRNASGARVGKVSMSLEQCLQQFASPETLADPVDCPSCRRKTPTKKQHTFAKLPKILCLHLKRFDAAKNRKIDDFVSFPAHGLDMGNLLPHWCESGIGDNSKQDADASTSPQVLYDLFATANHTGTLHQGHYVSNVKVGEEWFHCNDAHVSRYDESDVLQSEGAYVLFYIRR